MASELASMASAGVGLSMFTPIVMSATSGSTSTTPEPRTAIVPGSAAARAGANEFQPASAIARIKTRIIVAPAARP
jgi:hypothetical protein